MADRLFDKATEMFGKGIDAASDILGKGKDMASDVVNSAGDLGKRGVVRAKIADANLEYERLMKRLGTVLYEELKNDPKYAEANQGLFKEIQTCVDRRQALEDELSEIDAASAAKDPIEVNPVAPAGAEAAAASEGESVPAGDKSAEPADGAAAASTDAE